MADPVSWLWIPATVIGAAAQTARNAMQRHLTATLGTMGATSVRFIYGFPFGLALLAIASLIAGRAPPMPSGEAILWIAVGGATQIAGTACQLTAMRLKAFALAVAYAKTEPILIAVFAFVALGEILSPVGLAAILVATAGVIAMSGNPLRNGVDLRATLYGIAAGAGFGVSAVCYRGGILELAEPSFFLAATTALAVALFLQAVAMIVWFAWRHPATLTRIFAERRRSAFAGLMGACASAGWFSGFALAPAALVRTLALVEVFFSMLVGRNLMAQRLTGAEAFGLALIVAGVSVLLLFG